MYHYHGNGKVGFNLLLPAFRRAGTSSYFFEVRSSPQKDIWKGMAHVLGMVLMSYFHEEMFVLITVVGVMAALSLFSLNHRAEVFYVDNVRMENFRAAPVHFLFEFVTGFLVYAVFFFALALHASSMRGLDMVFYVLALVNVLTCSLPVLAALRLRAVHVRAGRAGSAVAPTARGCHMSNQKR